MSHAVERLRDLYVCEGHNRTFFMEMVIQYFQHFRIKFRISSYGVIDTRMASAMHQAEKRRQFKAFCDEGINVNRPNRI